MSKAYLNPKGYEGIGSDIKWCNRIKGRKKCCFCFRHSELEVWTKEWNWFYLLRWYDQTWYYEEYAHFRTYKQKWKPHTSLPVNYRNTGLYDYDLKALIRKGCKNNKRCKCMNIVQRAFWYCPDCYNVIKSLAKLERRHIHDIMLSDRNELKAQVLILRLSGSIQF